MHLTGKFPEVVGLPSISTQSRKQQAETFPEGLEPHCWTWCQGAWPWVLPLQKEGETHSRVKNKYCCSALDFPRG